MNIPSSCVAVYPASPINTDNISIIVKKLLSLDYPASRLSVIGKGSLMEDHTIGIYKQPDQIRYKGKQDQFWIDLWGLLAGEAFFLIPEFGSLAVAGSLSSIIMSENNNLNYSKELNVLGKALHDVGIPDGSINHYESVLKSGQLMLIAHGNTQEIELAGRILELSKNIKDVSLHFVNSS